MNRFLSHSCFVFLGFTICGMLTLDGVVRPSWAQQNDRVEVVRGAGRSVTGKINQLTPFGVSIQASDGLKQFNSDQVSKLIYQGQPTEIERARTQMNAGRFDGAIEELQKISSAVSRPEIQQEIEFIIARSNAEISLRSGAIPPQDAGRGILEFIQKHPNSIHLYPATELLGKLLFAVGKFDLAEAEFRKLGESKWAELILKGNFHRGQTLIEQGKFSDAAAAYRAILDASANDDLTLTFKLLAKIQLAKVDALQGNTDSAIKTLEEIIRVEDSSNAIVFSHLYNALGTAFLKQENLKEAMMAFLHTDLLYTVERDAHAEALYHLAQLWPQLGQNDRANRARQNLKSRYRNSLWAMKLQ